MMLPGQGRRRRSSSSIKVPNSKMAHQPAIVLRGPRQRRRPLQQPFGKRDGVGFHQGAVLPVRHVHHLEANWVLCSCLGCCKTASQISNADCTPNPGDGTQHSSATDEQSCAMSLMTVHGRLDDRNKKCSGGVHALSDVPVPAAGGNQAHLCSGSNLPSTGHILARPHAAASLEGVCRRTCCCVRRSGGPAYTLNCILPSRRNSRFSCSYGHHG